MHVLLSVVMVLMTGISGIQPDTSLSLPRSTPESQGLSSDAIKAFVDAADSEIDAMNSFMLVRHGQVIAEAWWSPYKPDVNHILYSLSKSFTSTAVGLAVAEGRFSIDDEVLKFFPEDAPAAPSDNLKAMRVSDLLRMNTGHQTEVAPGDNEPWTRTFLAHPVPFKPGTHFLYNTPATYMLSAIVQKTTGMTVLDYLRPRLFEPLGIEHPTWDTSPQGISLGGYGLSVRTEDIARLGQLYLQRGVWNGKRILPDAWVREATALQTSNGSNPNSDWDQGYGYQFWQSRHGYRGDGAFGQYCLVLPEYDAVVAITSGVRDMQAVMNLVWTRLLPAMKEQPLPENAAGVDALKARLASLSLRMPQGGHTSPLTASVSGKVYSFPENDRGIQNVSFNFSGTDPVLTIGTAGGQHRLTIGNGSWQEQESAFINGLDGRVLAPGLHPLAVSGAWVEDGVYQVRLSLFETPFYSTLSFRFEGDQLLFDAEHNVNFGMARLPRLTGSPTGNT